MSKLSVLLAGVAVLAVAAPGAQAQSGPVGRSCAAEIAKLCAGKPHDGSTRVCLEQSYTRLGDPCKKALDTTGGGRGKGLGRGQGKRRPS